MNSLFLDRFGIRTGALCFALALSTGTLACAVDGGEDLGEEEIGEDDTSETDGGGDGDGDVELSHAADIQPIWNANCVAACHEPGGTAATFLDLSGDAYAAIVDVTSIQAPGLSVVETGNAADSYLVAKLRNMQVEVGGNGVQMPSGVAPLPEETIATIEAWIDGGALP